MAVRPKENLNAITEQWPCSLDRQKESASERWKKKTATKVISTITHSNLFFTHFSLLVCHLIWSTFAFETTTLAAVVLTTMSTREYIEEKKKKNYMCLYTYVWKLGARVKDMRKKNTHQILYTCRTNETKTARMNERERAHEFEKEKKSHN